MRVYSLWADTSQQKRRDAAYSDTGELSENWISDGINIITIIDEQLR